LHAHRNTVTELSSDKQFTLLKPTNLPRDMLKMYSVSVSLNWDARRKNWYFDRKISCKDQEFDCCTI